LRRRLRYFHFALSVYLATTSHPWSIVFIDRFQHASFSTIGFEIRNFLPPLQFAFAIEATRTPSATDRKDKMAPFRSTSAQIRRCSRRFEEHSCWNKQCCGDFHL
jgi:hypothetical protein